MNTGALDGYHPLSQDELIKFCQSFGALLYKESAGPMWPGAQVQNQFVQVWYRRTNGEYRTIIFYKPFFSKSRQLHAVEGSESVVREEDLAQAHAGGALEVPFVRSL